MTRKTRTALAVLTTTALTALPLVGAGAAQAAPTECAPGARDVAVSATGSDDVVVQSFRAENTDSGDVARDTWPVGRSETVAAEVSRGAGVSVEEAVAAAQVDITPTAVASLTTRTGTEAVSVEVPAGEVRTGSYAVFVTAFSGVLSECDGDGRMRTVENFTGTAPWGEGVVVS